MNENLCEKSKQNNILNPTMQFYSNTFLLKNYFLLIFFYYHFVCASFFSQLNFFKLYTDVLTTSESKDYDDDEDVV